MAFDKLHEGIRGFAKDGTSLSSLSRYLLMSIRSDPQGHDQGQVLISSRRSKWIYCRRMIGRMHLCLSACCSKTSCDFLTKCTFMKYCNQRIHHEDLASCIALIIRLPTFVASSNRGAKKSTHQLITSNGLINIPAVSWNRLWYNSKLPNVTHSAHPLAATTNSISSGR
jgi:hypothetical protein